MKFVGVNIGALTVKIVAIQGEDKFPRVVAHRGRPLPVAQELISGAGFADANYFGVSGHLLHISECAAGSGEFFIGSYFPCQENQTLSGCP